MKVESENLASAKKAEAEKGAPKKAAPKKAAPKKAAPKKAAPKKAASTKAPPKKAAPKKAARKKVSPKKAMSTATFTKQMIDIENGADKYVDKEVSKEAHRNVESDKDIAKAAAHFAQRVKATAQLQLEANPQQLDAGHKANAELRGKAAGLKVMTNSLKKMKGSENVKKALEDAKKVADAEEKKVTSAALAQSKAHVQKLASGGAKSAMADAALKKLQLNKALNNLKATQKAHAENAKAA